MQLREWLFKNRITGSEFAKRLDFSRGHLYNYMAGRYRISKKLAKYIEEETNGEVTAKEALKYNPKEKKCI